MELTHFPGTNCHAREIRSALLGDEATPMAVRLGCPRALWDRVQALNVERRSGRPAVAPTARPAFSSDEERRRHSEAIAAKIYADEVADFMKPKQFS